MMTAPPNFADQKRDLHVGGLGSRTGGALAAITHPLEDDESFSDWASRARILLDDAQAILRENPWAAIAAGTFVGLGLGYLLGRRG